MNKIINVYCDESCHLQNDESKVMVLGAVWCPKENTSLHAQSLREIKKKHGFVASREIKWSKISQSHLNFYLEWVDYFFDKEDLHLRGLIISDKSKLDHQSFNQTHDDWYYKMYFEMLKTIIDSDFKYHIYIDIKVCPLHGMQENWMGILLKRDFGISLPKQKDPRKKDIPIFVELNG